VNLDRDPPADIRHDIRSGLPYENEGFTHVYSEHAIEHFTAVEGLSILRECHRVLKPGGTLRLSTPDLRILAALYTRATMLTDTGLLDRVEGINPLRFYESVGFVAETQAQLLNDGMRRWGHLFLYDELEMTILLKAAGFRIVRREMYQHTAVLGMLVEGRPDCKELIMEAVK
jgi:predicted SAM-dependent methyltransferase